MSKIKFLGKSFKAIKSISNEQKAFELLVGQCADSSAENLVSLYTELSTQENFNYANKHFCSSTLRRILRENSKLNTKANLTLTLHKFKDTTVAIIFNTQILYNLDQENRKEEKVWQSEEGYLRLLRSESEDLIEALGCNGTENNDLD
jgi:hypothetical protein